MSKVKVICTSTGCVEYGPERYRELGIGIIRIHMMFQGKEYLEGPELDPIKFYDELLKLEEPKNNLPKTALPTVDEVYAVFDSAIEEGCDEIIAYTISSALGGTYNAVCLFAKDYEKTHNVKIHVVDTRAAAFLEGYHAIRAVEMLNEGMTTEQVLKESAWAIDHQRFIGVVTKLDYLVYNGRLKGAKAFFGKMLSICPFLSFNKEGQICPVESIRTPKKAMNRTCEVLGEILGDRSPEDYMLCHIYTSVENLKVFKEIEAKYGIQTNHEDVVMSPVSGCHNGPYLIAYGVYLKRRPDEPLED